MNDVASLKSTSRHQASRASADSGIVSTLTDTTPVSSPSSIPGSLPDSKNLRKLCSLVRFHAEELMRGTTKLSLSVDVLGLILRLISGDAADITTDGSDPLLFEAACLQDVLKSVLKLKVCSATSPSSPSKRVDLSVFEQLCVLEIIGVPLEAIGGLGPLARRLTSVTLEKCRFQHGIRNFFVDAALPYGPKLVEEDDDDGVEEAVEWPELREANIVRNVLESLDSSLTLAPRLKILDASFNSLTDAGVECLARFGQLTRINLSFNKLRSVPMFGPGSGVYLHTLLLRNNSLETLSGIEILASLKVLDVSFNLMAWPGAFESLKSLSALTSLHLEGNPVYYSKTYRSSVMKNLHPSVMTRKFTLDGKSLTPVEKEAVKDSALDRISATPNFLPNLDFAPRRTPDPETSSFGGASQSSSQPRSKRRVREAEIGFADETEALRSSFAGIHSSGINPDRTPVSNVHVVRAIIEKRPSSTTDPGSPRGSRGGSPAGAGKRTPLSSTPVDVFSTKEKLKALRNQYGSDNWLGALASSDVTGILGLAAAAPSPIVHETDADEKHEAVIKPALNCRRSISFDPDQSKKDEPREAAATDGGGEQMGDHSDSLDNLESEDVVSYPCGLAGTDDEKQLRIGLSGTVDSEGRLTVAEIRERDAVSGTVLSRWDVYCLTKVEVDAADEPASIAMTFKTIRKNAGSRVYLMSTDNCWALAEFLKPFWEEVEGTGSDLGAWECVKCSSQFAKERKAYDPKRGTKNSVRCPICDSDMVVSLDTLPEPMLESSASSSSLITKGHLASRAEKGEKPNGFRKTSVQNRKDKESSLQPRCSSADSSDASSRNSGERSSSSTPRATAPVFGDRLRLGRPVPGAFSGPQPPQSDASSDIEVLSRGSSSSIEVLAREDPEGQEDESGDPPFRGGGAGAGKGAGGGAVLDSPTGSYKSGVNMTSSTSSESMTASYHTAYNLGQKTMKVGTPPKLSESLDTNASTGTLLGSQASPSPRKHEIPHSPAMPIKPLSSAVVPYVKSVSVLSSSYTKLFPDRGPAAESSDAMAIVSTSLTSGAVFRHMEGAIQPVIDVLSKAAMAESDTEETGKKDESEDHEPTEKDFYSLSVLKTATSSRLASGKRWRAKDSLYFLEEKLDSSVDKLNESSMLNLEDDGMTDLMMRYDYDNFGNFDHRLNLFCDIALFQDSGEELLGIARGEVYMSGCDHPQAAILAVSSQNVYFLKIFGKETEDPDKWLTRLESKPLENLTSIAKIVGGQGLAFISQSKNPVIVFLTGDAERTEKLQKFLSERVEEKCNRDTGEMVDFQMCQLETSLLDFFGEGNIDPCYIFFALTYAKSSHGSWDQSGVLLTATHISVITSDLKWLLSVPHSTPLSPTSGKKPTVRHLYSVADVGVVETHSRLPSVLSLIFVEKSAKKRRDSENLGLAEGKNVRDCVSLAFETPRTARGFLAELKSSWSSLYSGAELVVEAASFVE